MAVSGNGFDVRIFDRLARCLKDNTAGSDVIIDRVPGQRMIVGIRKNILHELEIHSNFEYRIPGNG